MIKMSKKGFTLIELLAVIVILAIIALIATPIVLNIIKDSRESATLRSAENYMDAVANAIARTNMKEGGTFSPTICNITSDGNLLCDNKEITVDIDKEKPSGGSITFNKGKVEDVSLNYSNGKTIVDDEKGNLVYGELKFSFATDSWATIKANVNTGVYNVGDEREIELDVDGDGTSTSYTLRIANLPSEEEKTESCGTEGFSETSCGFVVEFKDIISMYNMNPAGTYNGTYYPNGTNIGGWPASEMRKYIGGYKDTNGNIVNGTIYKAFPSDLKSVLKDTYVVSSHGSGDKGTRSDENFESIDSLYLLSLKEVWGSNPYNGTSTVATRQLDYYKEKGVTESSYSGAIKQYNGSDYYWWLRSASSFNTIGFRGVDSNGCLCSDSPRRALGVAVAFRIG